MTKVELFELIRKEHFIHGKSIRQIARERHVHRRLVRQAITSAVPPSRKRVERASIKLTSDLKQKIDAWLQDDLSAPKKQRHTAKRIYTRLVEESGYTGSEHSIRKYVGQRRGELGLSLQAFVPQHYHPGDHAEVDWYEAKVYLQGQLTTVYFFLMRASCSGKEFHMSFLQQNQQAFLAAHVAAFSFFGGVFRNIRYDNLTSAVKKVLRGRKRLETEKFALLRSHYLFEADFCRPGVEGAHEKGGVEGAVGRFRRNHLVPVPSVESIRELNQQLLSCCEKDDSRTIIGKTEPIKSQWLEESPTLLPLPNQEFDCDEVVTVRVNKKGYVRLKGNDYTAPVHLTGMQIEARLSPCSVALLHKGKKVADHERALGTGHVVADIGHYLPLFTKKPGALSGSLALAQAREKGVWPSIFDEYWDAMKLKYGASEGTRQWIEILQMINDLDVNHCTSILSSALECGSLSADSIKVIVRQRLSGEQPVEPLQELGELAKYDRPIGDLREYDHLLSREIH